MTAPEPTTAPDRGDQVRIVIEDLVSWLTPIAGTVPEQFTHHRGWKGDRITLPASEAARLGRLGGVAEPADAKQAAAELAATYQPIPDGEDGDAELLAMKATDLIAYVTQFPAQRRRVALLEAGRPEKERRKTVLVATDVHDEDPREPMGALARLEP